MHIDQAGHIGIGRHIGLGQAGQHAPVHIQLGKQRSLLGLQGIAQGRAAGQDCLVVIGFDALGDGIDPPGQLKQIRILAQTKTNPGVFCEQLGGQHAPLVQHLDQFGETQCRDGHHVIAVQVRVEDQVRLVGYRGQQGAGGIDQVALHCQWQQG